MSSAKTRFPLPDSPALRNWLHALVRSQFRIFTGRSPSPAHLKKNMRPYLKASRSFTGATTTKTVLGMADKLGRRPLSR